MLRLTSIIPGISVTSYSVARQTHGYNCGPWTIEIFRALLKGEDLPNEDFDIAKARRQQLRSIDILPAGNNEDIKLE